MLALVTARDSTSAASHATAAQQGVAAVLQACVSLASYVLPTAAADTQTMSEAVQSIEAALDMPLLLRAVRSQSIPLVSHPLLMRALAMACMACREPIWRGESLAGIAMLQTPFRTLPAQALCCPAISCCRLHHRYGVCGAAQVQMVLEWTSADGVDLLAGKPGPHGLTALHMAAVMEDGAKLAALLLGGPLCAASMLSSRASACPVSAQCFPHPPFIKQQMRETGSMMHAPSRVAFRARLSTSVPAGCPAGLGSLLYWTVHCLVARMNSGVVRRCVPRRGLCMDCSRSLRCLASTAGVCLRQQGHPRPCPAAPPRQPGCSICR